MGDKRLVFFLVLVALVSSSRLSYLILYALALVVLVCYGGVRQAFRHLRVERSLSCANAYAGQEIEVTVTVRNGSRLPLGWISVKASNPGRLWTSGTMGQAGLLRGRSGLTLNYRVAGMRRGCYHLGDIVVCGGDPLGLNTRDAIIRDPGEVLTVYPPVTVWRKLPLPQVRPFGNERDVLRAYEDPSRLSGIRDYQPGDSRRRIHWKASASRGRLQVKEFVPTVTAESLILLDLNSEAYGERGDLLGELAVETAASLLAHFVSKGIKVGLAASGADPWHQDAGVLVMPPAPGPGQAEAVLSLLARIELAPGLDCGELLTIYGREAAWGVNIYLITPRWGRELAGIALDLGRTGKSVLPMLLEPAGRLERTTLAGLRWLAVNRDRERGEVRLGDVG